MIKKKYMHCSWPIMVIILYSIYFYIVEKGLFVNGWMISLKDITTKNIGRVFVGDFLVMLILPTVLCLIYRKRLNKLGIVESKMSYTLLIIYLIFFFLHKDFSISGFYKAFFYIFVVAAAEEIIYRGYLFSKLKTYNRIFAILVSGSLWGMIHAILPGILSGNSIPIILLSMLDEIGGGIIGGLFFIYLFEYSGSILVPIIIHALLDYSYEHLGIVVAVTTFVYLLLIRKKERIKNEHSL